VVVDDAITPTAYDLSVTVDGEVVGVPNDRFERNENADQAPVLALGAYQDLRIVDTDVDVFAVDLVAGDRLNAAAALEVAGADDLSIAVTDDADAVLATGTSVPTGAEVVSVAPADGTYYVRVTGAGNATAAYDLTLRVGLAVSLSVDPQRLNAGPDEVVTVDVSLADADLNLSAYAFDLTVDPAVVTIAGVETLGSNLQVDTTVAPDGASASVDVVANDTLPSAGVTPLVRVTMLTGATDGESALTLTNASVVDGTGGAYPTSTVDGTVVVSTGPGDVGGGAPAGDLDGDGRFEDVDGDGKFNFIDIITLVFAIDRIDRGGLGSFFDFDGRGGFTFVDVIDLVFRL
jgi:PKD repeat protein